MHVLCVFFQAFPDNAARREVENLPAVCFNEGCSWKGSIKDYEVVFLNISFIDIQEQKYLDTTYAITSSIHGQFLIIQLVTCVISVFVVEP